MKKSCSDKDITLLVKLQGHSILKIFGPFIRSTFMHPVKINIDTATNGDLRFDGGSNINGVSTVAS